MDDATSRAREVIADMFLHGEFRVWIENRKSDNQNSDDVLERLRLAGLSIIDTRTHVAVPRERSDEMVERVAQAVFDRMGGQMTWGSAGDRWRAHFVADARAAIAALTQEGG